MFLVQHILERNQCLESRVAIRVRLKIFTPLGFMAVGVKKGSVTEQRGKSFYTTHTCDQCMFISWGKRSDNEKKKKTKRFLSDLTFWKYPWLRLPDNNPVPSEEMFSQIMILPPFFTVEFFCSCTVLIFAKRAFWIYATKVESMKKLDIKQLDTLSWRFGRV